MLASVSILVLVAPKPKANMFKTHILCGAQLARNMSPWLEITSKDTHKYILQTSSPCQRQYCYKCMEPTRTHFATLIHVNYTCK